jgi:selT/selW/selH-like putative selenoprotein
MKIIIKYCVVWNYEPRALRVGARFAELPGAEIAYERSGGGVFEITVDGKLKFSKKALGRFPTDEEIDAIAKAA